MKQRLEAVDYASFMFLFMKDYTGIKKNLLTAKEFYFIKDKRNYWLFYCDCGKEIVLRIDKVLSKNPQNKSCGCLINRINKNPNNIDDCLTSFLFYRYKNSAKKRNYIFNLSFEIFKKLINKSCYYCGQIPNRKQFHQYNKDVFILVNGIDRKNNEIGYLKENCLPCCTICNKAKRNLSFDVFMKWIENFNTS